MPIGLVSDEEFETEINSINTPPPILESNIEKEEEVVITAEVLQMKMRGRNGALEVPPMIRGVIAETALEGASPDEISEVFGVSKSSISAYKNGATSTTTYNEGNKNLKEVVARKKRFIAGRARNTLNQALNAITPEKLSESDAKSLAGVAKDMSVIIRNMEPPVESNNSDRPNVQYVFMAPPPKQENYYEVIEVKE